MRVLAFITALGIATAAAQHPQGGCLTEKPKPHTGPGFPMHPPPTVTWCAPPMGTIVEDDEGNPVCGPGQCIDDAAGRIVCAKEVGGSVTVDRDGQVKCVGGCQKANRMFCRRPQ